MFQFIHIFVMDLNDKGLIKMTNLMNFMNFHTSESISNDCMVLPYQNPWVLSLIAFYVFANLKTENKK